MQPKFSEGSSQHSLLKSRIKALYIAKSLITDQSNTDKYTKDELMAALPPISSIISKCEKAQQKHTEGAPFYARFQNIINAMYIAKLSIAEEINKMI